MKDLLLYNFIILGSGTIATLYTASRKYLNNKGFSEEYIRARKSFAKRLGVIQLLTFFITQGVILLIFWLTKTEMNYQSVVMFFLPGVFIPLIPVTIIINRQFNRDYKELASNTGEDVVIDFDYKLLYKFFNIKIEAPLTITVLVLAFISLKNSGFSTLLYSILIPWMMFLINRFARNMNVASYKESYKNMFIFGIIYSILLPAVAGIHAWINIFDDTSSPITPGFIATGLLIGKMILTIVKHPSLIRELNSVVDKEE